MSKQVSLEQEVTVRLPEHEVLLSFNRDEDAEWFWEWWKYHGGENLFWGYVADCKDSGG